MYVDGSKYKSMRELLNAMQEMSEELQKMKRRFKKK